MFKKIMIIMIVVAMAAAFAACSDPATVPLGVTISPEDEQISVSVPVGWTNEESLLEQKQSVLALAGGNELYVDVYYIADYTYEDYVTDLVGYYAEGDVGEPETLTLDGVDASKFHYRALGTTIESEEALYYGYEYVVDAPFGVIEIDAYRSFLDTKTEAKPSDGEMKLLQRIAESLQINE